MKKLILLFAVLCSTVGSWADFQKTWTNAPTPWSMNVAANVPDGVQTVFNNHKGNGTAHSIHMASTYVSSIGGDVSVSFTYVSGNHMLVILGVDLVNESGNVAYSDYKAENAGGGNNGGAHTYTMPKVAAGNYTLRYFVCNKAGDHSLTETNGGIVVTGLTEEIGPSTSEDTPEYVYTIKTKSSFNSWMTSYTSPTGTRTSVARFAFYAVDEKDDTYKIMCVDTKKWVSYTEAGSYAEGVNFVKFAADKASAKEWKASYVTSKNAFQFAPYNTTSSVEGKYMNWYNGVNSNALDNTTTTVGLYSTDGASDDGSAWELFMTPLPSTKEITDLASLSNDKVYTIKSGRSTTEFDHYLLYHTGAPNNLASTYSGEGHPVAYSVTNPNFQFAIYKFADKYYLYNIVANKFVGNNSNNNGAIPWTVDPTNSVEIRTESTVAGYKFMLSTNGSGALNVANTGGRHGVVNWSDGYSKTGDSGNAFHIVEVGDLQDEDKAQIEKKIQLKETYVLKSGTDYWMSKSTSPTIHKPARFTFSAVDDKEGAFKILSVNQGQWISYEQADSYTGGQSIVVWADTEAAANYWKVDLQYDGTYRISPYLTSGEAAEMYMQWHGGVGSGDGKNPIDGTTTVGLYSEKNDAASKWTLTPVTDNTYLVFVPNATRYTVTHNQTSLPNIDGSFFVSDAVITNDNITITTDNGYATNVSIDADLKVIVIACTPNTAFLADGKKVIFKNRSHSTYMMARFVGGNLDDPHSLTRQLWGLTGSYDYKNCWELKATTHNETSCYFLYNPYYGYYVGQLASSGKAVDLVNNSEWAGKFVFEVGANAAGATGGESYFVVKCINKKDVVTNYYLNQLSTGGVAESTNTDIASHWELFEVTEANLTTWNTNLTAEFEFMKTCTLGTGLGQYGAGMTEAQRTEFESLAITGATDLEKAKYCVHSLYEFKPLVVINQPETGKFYRIKSNSSNNYVDAVNLHSGTQMGLKSASDYSPEGTIFFYDSDKYMLNYGTGTYVYDTRHINANPSNTKSQWTFSGSTYNSGRYSVQSKDNQTTTRYLHDSDGNRADRCSNICGSRHDWIVESVTSLPFTFYTAALGYATFNAPVAVQLPEGVTAYVAEKLNETTLKMWKIVGNNVPADTPVLLYKTGLTEDTEVSLTILGEDVTIEGLDSKDAFVGTVAAANLDATKNCYSLQKSAEEGENAVGFYSKTSGTKAGFKAWVETDNTSEARAFRIIFDGDDATGIKEALGLENENVEIYDLSGRRLDKPTKGVNVVGGKVMIVR